MAGPENGVDLSGLTPEKRTALANLITPEGGAGGGEGAGPSSGTQDPVDGTPAWAQELTRQFKDLSVQVTALDNSNKTVHGILRRMETPAKAEPQPTEEDPFEGLDLEDPATKILANRLRAAEAKIKTLQGGAREAQLSAADQEQKAHWLVFLEGMATELGVDWADVEPAIRRIPLDTLANDGKTVITKAARAGSTPSANGATGKDAPTGQGDPPKDGELTDFQKGVNKGVQDTAEHLGIWDAIRPTGSGAPDSDVTAEKLKGMSVDEITALNLSDEALEKILA